MNARLLPELDFLFMRHAHSVDNAQGRIPHPELCEGLSEVGRGQVLQAIQALKHYPQLPEVIVTSPLRRARVTADMISEAFDLPLVEMPELAEQNLGQWAGQPWQNIAPYFADRVNPPGGEIYSEFYDRITRALTKLSLSQERKLVVSHGGVWHGVKALHGDFATDWPPNASIGRVTMQQNHLHLQPYFVPTQMFSPTIGRSPEQ